MLQSPAKKSFLLPESAPHYAPPKEFHIEHVRIELGVDFANKGIAGSCTLKVKPIRDGLDKIVLDACDMIIEGVNVDGSPGEFEYDGERLMVRISAKASDTCDIRVDYKCVPREGVNFIGPDAQHPEKPLQAWTQGEAQLARFWYPCHDYPDDKCTSETIITVPKGYTVVSNGELISKSETGETVSFHWKEDRPHSSYLTSFVAGKFGEIREAAEGVPLHYFFPESKRDDVARYFGETPKMIRIFTEITGAKYPFAKYAQTTVEDFVYGGMENVDATTLTTNRFHDAQSAEDFQVSYGSQNRNAVNLVAHELAHQWFGDLVTCSDWTHAWLNEGFADYMQVLYIERTRGVDAARWDMLMKSQDAFDEDESEYRRPIVEKCIVYADDLFDSTTYEKGAWMIHELRHLMGDRAFFKGVHEYVARFSYKNADTQDLRKVMEEVSGLSLEQFFEQAFFMAGYPEFEVSYSWERETKTATVLVKQVQKLEQKTPIFVLPCDLVFYTQKGRQSKRVLVHAAEQAFSFELDSEPTVVEFDPEEWLLKKASFKKGVRLLVNQLERSADASSRAAAARDLGESKAGDAVEALKRAATSDQFWHVQACALKALGEIGTQLALDALLETGMPSNRRVRRALAEALGSFKDQRARTTLEELLASDPSPYVRSEAALSLGKAAGADALPALKAAMKATTPNETLAEACLAAMGKIDAEEVSGILRDCLAYGRPTRVRIGAMKGIKERGRLLDYEVPLLKRILLGDMEYSVREYLVSKLIPEVADRRLVDALKEASRMDRDNRIKRKALEAYYQISNDAETGSAFSRLKEEVERLKAQIRQPAQTGPR